MILLFASFVSSIVYSICAKTYTTFLTKKPAGMETLFDKAVILAINYHNIIAWNYVLVFTLASLNQHWDEKFAITMSILLVLNVINNALIMIHLALVRYFCISWLNRLDLPVSDAQIVKAIQVTSLLMAIAIITMDFTFKSDIKKTAWYVMLTGRPLEDSRVPQCTRVVIALTLLSYIILQVYVELRKISPPEKVKAWTSSNPAKEEHATKMLVSQD